MKKEDIVVYEIYIKSFKDSNNDGIGDFQGIIENLPYLFKLGITHILLSPIHPTTNFDNGYDITDYYGINPEFGTLEDFKSLIVNAEKYKIKIIMDMVFNHTSIKHPWFLEAIKGRKKYQNYYFFRTGEKDGKPPNNWISKFNDSAWEYLPDLEQWYLHIFSKYQADLNWQNIEVRNEIYKIVVFWLKLGIKGLRFDVINLIAKPDFLYTNIYLENDLKDNYKNELQAHKYLQKLAKHTYRRFNNIFTVGEMVSLDLRNATLFSDPDRKELSAVFSFHHLKIDYLNNQKWTYSKFDIESLKRMIIRWQWSLQKYDGWSGNFFSNHDQPRQLSRFGDSKNYRYESATAIATTYMLLRGTPFIFYGEEIGMKNLNFKKIEDFRDPESIENYHRLLKRNFSSYQALMIINQKSRDNGRGFFPWNDDQKYFGFSESEPWIGYSNSNQVSLSKDLSSQKSIFHFYKNLIKLRKEKKAFRLGRIEFKEVNRNLFVYKRIHNFTSYLVIANWSDKTISFEFNFKKIVLNNYSNFKRNQILPYQTLVLKE